MQIKEGVEPIPDMFANYEEAGRFWDSHDTADYPDDFTDVKVDVQLQGERFDCHRR